jgi:hypothetical protein
MTDWKEVVAEGEAAELERLAARLRTMQKARAEKGRALHLKQHAGVRATLHTFADLPEWARIGIFSAAAEHAAYVRFSNGSGLHAPDRAPDVRGIAVKIVGVPGKKLIQGLEDAKTQDFLGILTQTVPFRNPKEFVGVVLAAAGSPVLLLPRMIGALGFRLFGMLPKLQAPLKTPVPSLGKAVFYSALPIRWGKTAVKFSLVPLSVPDGAEIPKSEPDRLRVDLAARLAKGSIEWELRVQPFASAEKTPIEDPTKEWESPWTAVGKLAIPKQDLTSAEGKALDAKVAKMSFDPWHAPEEFRPLGAMMRARAIAYRESTIERGATSELALDDLMAFENPMVLESMEAAMQMQKGE